MKRSDKYVFLFLIIVAISVIRSFGQDPWKNIPVISDQKREFSYPWAGGMNSCQFGSIDLDLDGRKDLVVFDRTGNRLMTFINHGNQGQIDYRFEPGYASSFPALFDWMILADYNNDGYEDIFTYSPGYAGMMVYKNTSQSKLEFRLEVFPYLKSFQGGGYTNILVTYADYPGISDIDYDGDLDILTFWGLGSFVEFHKNLSIEKYGHSDSLDFMKTEYCWGHFAESPESNVIVLDTCIGEGDLVSGQRSAVSSQQRSEATSAFGGFTVPSSQFPVRRSQFADPSSQLPGHRHTGSTFCLLDLNNDQVNDLLLGDVDYPNLIALTNNGTADTANIISQDPDFPADNRNIRLFSMPAAFYTDVDNDDIPDLIVSPFDPNPYIAENFESVWFYKNAGTTSQPDFVFQNGSFLQDNMLDFGSGAYPITCDYDGNGLMDLLIGNYGYYDTSYYDQYMMLHSEYSGQIALLKNVGSLQQPAFQLVTRDFAGISALGLRGIIPALADLDGDGDLDLLLGNENGNLIYFRNKAGQGQPMELEFAESGYQDIDVGDASAPQLVDLDGDELQDLVIGERGGNLNYYRNTGTSQLPVFVKVTDSLGKVNVTDYSVSLNGYSTPYFFRNPGGKWCLLVGSEQGKLFFYNNITNPEMDIFEESDSLSTFIGIDNFNPDRGFRTMGMISDWNNDTYPELITGNFSGGLEYLPGTVTPVVSGLQNLFDYQEDLTVYPTPSKEEVIFELSEKSGFLISKIDVFSYNGSGIFSIDIQNSRRFVLNVRSVPAGIYLCNLHINNGPRGQSFIISKKIIKVF